MSRLATKPLYLIAAIFLLLFIAESKQFRLLEPIENRLMDYFVRLQAATLAPDPAIVIVDIDEASLAKMQDIAGKWPWPRSVHADLIRGVLAQQPKAIVFDIQFAERDVYRPDSDKQLNDALVGVDRVYFPLVRLDAKLDPQGAPIAKVAPLLGLVRGPGADPQARIALVPPLALDPQHWRAGAINFLEDADGVGRRYHVQLPAYGWAVPSLPARVAADLGYPLPAQDDIILGWRTRGWQAGLGAYRHISYADLYLDFERSKRQRDARELKDKIVIVGATASGLHDVRATPVTALHPGAEILATAIDNLKNRGYMRTAPATIAFVVGLALLAALSTGFLRRVNALRLGVGLAGASLVLLGASYVAVGARLLLPVFTPLAFAWLLYFAAALAEYLRERKAREQAVRMFSRFLNPEVVKSIVERGETIESLSGRNRDISVLFSDIRGFTSLSETRPPQEIVQLLNRYFSLQVAVVFRNQGTLDKFIGDCIMAFWGAPLDDPLHARHAVACALEMQEVLQQFRRELGTSAEDFDVGIGIHSGSAVVGFIGAEQKLDYTVIGDTVNLASRIEGLTKGVARILVSRETMQGCGDAFDFVPHGSYKVKGRAQEVELFEPKKKTQ